MKTIQTEKLIGLPWQFAEAFLQAASVPYTAEFGQNFNRFFSIAETGAYVARVTIVDGVYHILLYRPMIDSGFGSTCEVKDAQIDSQTK